MKHRFGAIGAGHMGLALLNGIVQGGLAAPKDILVYDVSPDAMSAAREKGYTLGIDEQDIYQRSDRVMLAVLPQQITDLLEKLALNTLDAPPLVISIVSGTSSTYIRRFLGDKCAVIRVVPNITMSVGAGATVLARTENVASDVFEPLKKVFESFGQTVEIGEGFLNEVIPANGCAPGYAFYFMDAIARAVAETGIDYAMAVRLVAQSFAGAAAMALKPDASLETLLEQVCSPGGLTQHAINRFEALQVASNIAEGVNASILRGHDLAR